MNNQNEVQPSHVIEYCTQERGVPRQFKFELELVKLVRVGVLGSSNLKGTARVVQAQLSMCGRTALLTHPGVSGIWAKYRPARNL